MILVGYTQTGYQLLKPEEGKIYQSRNVFFNEKLVHGDSYEEGEIVNWFNDNIEINNECWFHKFDDEKTEENFND